MSPQLKTGNIRLDKQLARWYPLKPHQVQLDLIAAVDKGIRFPLVPAGRRSGKTERFKRFIVKKANAIEGQYFAAAPTYNQAKKIFWNDLKALSLSSMHTKRPSESDLIIFLPNGSEIHVLGLDKPERIEGIPWKGGGIDEIADTKPEAWGMNILPALNTVNPLDPDYRAWCWLLGVPDGFNHYYDLCRKADSGKNSNFKVFHWKSSEILPDDVIQDARRALSEKQFNQEFNASFETSTGIIYDNYDIELNGCNTVEDGKETLFIGMDFNVGNMSAIVHVKRESNPHAVDEIIGLLDTPEMVSAIKNRYPDRVICVYPDASGQNRSTKNAGVTDISILETAGFKVYNDASNPFVKDRINSMKAMFCNASGERRYKINADKCPIYSQSLQKQVFDDVGNPDKKSGHDHTNDAGGYFINHSYSVIKKLEKLNVRF